MVAAASESESRTEALAPMKRWFFWLIPALAAAGTAPLPGRAASFTVSNANDAGAGSLRQAILDANSSPGANSITFNLPGAGVHTIAPLSSLPDLSGTVAVDGFTQPGAVINTLPNDNNGAPSIRLDGLNLTNGFPIGLRLNGASNSLVRGFIVVRFYTGLQLNNTSGTAIAGNWIGVDADGVARGGTGTGIDVTTSLGRSTANVLGGTDPGARNVIGGFHTGVSFFPNSADHNLVAGNFIGTDPTGTLPRGNLFDGVSVQSATNITIGGSAPGARNLICANGTGVGLLGSAGDVIRGNYFGTDAGARYALGNTGDAIDAQSCTAVSIGGAGAGNVIANSTGHGIFLFSSSNSVVQGNWIGTEPTATWAMGNGKAGIYLQSAGGNTLGGPAAGAGNVIAFNGAQGVGVASGDRANISANVIFDNGGPGIDLGADGPTTNHPGNTVTGPNQWQNYPVLTNAFSEYATTQIGGNLNSRAATAYRLEFFSGPPGYGLYPAPARVYLGATNVVTDANGNAAFNAVLPAAVATGDWVTATATDTLGNTSEFATPTPATTGVSTPPLTAGQAGAVLLLTWPSSAAGFQVEATGSLTPPTVWQPVTNAITDDGRFKRVTLTNSPGLPRRFFRLRR